MNLLKTKFDEFYEQNLVFLPEKLVADQSYLYGKKESDNELRDKTLTVVATRAQVAKLQEQKNRMTIFINGLTKNLRKNKIAVAEKQKEIVSLKIEIDKYKKLLVAIGAPEILINHPSILFGTPDTESMNWAKEVIKMRGWNISK